MQLRRLGNSDLLVAPICFGGNVFGWTADEARSVSLLDAFIERGFNFIDTADVYSRWVEGNSGGESEAIIGRWLKKRGGRDQVVIATKVGMDMGGGKVGLSPKYIREAVEASLRRLQTDYIDLYQSHRDDDSVEMEAVLETYSKLIDEGKVRYIGASNFTADRLAAAIEYADRDGYPRYQTIQPEYNLYTRKGFEAELAPLCMEKGISCINYYALASGFLTGKYRSKLDLTKSARGARSIERYLNDRGLTILKALDKVAADTGSTPARVALAWNMAQPAVAAPIASATSLAQLEDMIAAPALQLSEDLMMILNEASSGE